MEVEQRPDNGIHIPDQMNKKSIREQFAESANV
jgi:hypothetical protein